MHNEIQEFLKKHIGRCNNCGHKLQKIVHVHRTNLDGRVIYDSGLSLMRTHWDITEVDVGEPLGIGCTECERGPMFAVHADRLKTPKELQVYCESR